MSPFFWLEKLGALARQSKKSILAEARALDLMVASKWFEALNQWQSPGNAKIAGEDRQLWNAGETITQWIVAPETFYRHLNEASRSKTTRLTTGTAIFSALTNQHDLSWPVIDALPDASYTRFTDALESPTWGVWANRNIEFVAGAHVRSARWVKLHPHNLFPSSRWAVWIDANIIPLNGLGELLKEFQDSGHPMAAIPHPARRTIDEEISACARRGKDSVHTLNKAHMRLGGDPGVGLWETNVCMFDLRHPKLVPLLSEWWSLLEAGSHRDQISLPFAARRTKSPIHSLLPAGSSTRSDSRFVLVPHKHRAFTAAHKKLSDDYCNSRLATKLESDQRGTE